MSRKSLTDSLKFEDDCIALIFCGKIEEAYKMVCNYEMGKEFPRGLGVDWNGEYDRGVDIDEAKEIIKYLRSPDNKYGENCDIVKSALVFLRFMGVGAFTSGVVKLLARLIPELNKEDIRRINILMQDDFLELGNMIKIVRYTKMGFSEEQINQMLG